MYEMDGGMLETKVAGSVPRGDMNAAFGDFMQAFDGFKQANDERLMQIERRMSADVVTVEKVDRLNAVLDEQKQRMDQLTLKSLRPRMGGERFEGTGSGFDVEHRAAFTDYMRKGLVAGLAGIEAKAALSVGVDANGGYLVPRETEVEIGRKLAVISPIRSIASVREVSGSSYRKPFVTTGAATGWVAETGARAETDAPTLAALDFPTAELYAMPAATQSLLDDSAVDIDQWIANEVQTVFAEQEGAAFVSGDGVNKPKGFLAYPTIANASWEWGKIGLLKTGVSAGFAAVAPADSLIDLIYSLKAGYRQNAHWVMNRKTQGALRKLKDENDNYIWQPSQQIGGQPSVMGFPVVEAETMPDIAADSLSIAFGDFNRGYLIVDRLGVRILRDPYSAKPYVLFYTTKRVGGGVQDFDAIKLLQFGV